MSQNYQVNYKVLYSSFLLFILPLVITSGQDLISGGVKKNSIILDGSTFIWIGGMSLNYERSLINHDHFKLSSAAGFGGWYFYPLPKTYYGFSIPASFNTLIGSQNSFFELDLGARYTIFTARSDTDRYRIFPVINLGYRYQRHDRNRLIFRLFIGYSGAGLGIGKTF